MSTLPAPASLQDATEVARLVALVRAGTGPLYEQPLAGQHGPESRSSHALAISPSVAHSCTGPADRVLKAGT